MSAAQSDQTVRDGQRRDSRKKTYRKPRLEDYGTVVELTGSGAGTDGDGADPFAGSGAVG